MDRDQGHGTLLMQSAVAAAGIGLLHFAFRYRGTIMKKLTNIFGPRNALQNKQIAIVSTTTECVEAVKRIRRDCTACKILGFDCEWITVGGVRRPVALLQLGTHAGFCALFRLCHLRHIPQDLRELLRDESILKVGVATSDDAQKLSYDYGVGVASTFDLRYLADMARVEPVGLAKLAQTHLNIKLNKNWRLACSNWEAESLNDAQLNYAADDALVAIEIFKKLAKLYKPRYFWQTENTTEINEKIQDLLEKRYKYKSANSTRLPKLNAVCSPAAQNRQQQHQQTRKLSTKANKLYDNCMLEAPDGELLATTERRRADWYLDMNLAQKICDEPYTVRLNFEPSGRAVGDVGLYYKALKKNECVVCGEQEALLRKNVVPHEYRKHFPVVMKSHTSHDVLPLCPVCHRRSNMNDVYQRQKLAEQCNAPIVLPVSSTLQQVLMTKRNVRSAARALLHYADKIPEDKAAGLRQTLIDYYGPATVVNGDLLKQAMKVSLKLDKEAEPTDVNCMDHSQKVVAQYCAEFGGIVQLERQWRQHFVDSMQPKFMPPLWDINHSKRRLLIRADEGRVENEDLVVAGLRDADTNDADSLKQG